MFVASTERISVTLASATIFQDRENSSYQRTFYFRNWSTSTISLQFQNYVAGAWANLGVSFDVDLAGGGNDIVAKNITDSESLRVLGSGGSDDNELDVSFVRFYNDATFIWTSPVL